MKGKESYLLKKANDTRYDCNCHTLRFIAKSIKISYFYKLL